MLTYIRYRELVHREGCHMMVDKPRIHLACMYVQTMHICTPKYGLLYFSDAAVIFRLKIQI